MLNKKNNKDHKPDGQKSDQKPSLRFGYSPELRRLYLTNEAGELIDDTEEEPVVILDDDSCCI